MSILQFACYSVIGGVILGVGWRLIESFLEKRGNKA
jgi:hypothetical protein